MKIFVKKFGELTSYDLYEILRLRVDVFVVEQVCSYPEIDGKDLDAIHIYFKDGGQILAYAKNLYAKAGFVEDSEIFLLDGIEHVKMVLEIK